MVNPKGRNEIVSPLMKDDMLKKFVQENYSISTVSGVKLEFIRRSLKELVASKIDLSHYGPLILEIRKSGSMIISKNSQRFFYEDIERTIRNYL